MVLQVGTAVTRPAALMTEGETVLKRDRLRLATLCTALLMLIVAGCGSASKTPSQPGPGQVVAEFDLNIASGADPVDLDPRKTWVGPGYSINAHLFEALIFRKQTGDKVELVPVLAESWKNTSPTTWEFMIRQGVKFHNGDTLDAAAIAFTYTSMMEASFNTPLKTWTADIAKVEAKDASTLLITTKYPARMLLNSLAQVPIVSPRAVKEMGDAQFTKTPVGTGPYKFVSYAPNSTVVVERFDGYWGAKGKAKKITFRIMPENATRLAALEAGEVQVAENLPPDKMQKIKSTDGLDVLFSSTMRVSWMIPVFNNKWMANTKFRQALSLAIDRESIVKNILAGTTKVANSMSPPGTLGYDASLPPYPYDLEKAKRLLTESGYTNDVIKMGGPVGRYSMDKQVSEAVAGMLKKLGVSLELETLVWSSFIGKANEGAYDLYFVPTTDFTMNPSSHWRSTFYTKVGRTKFSNPRIDEIIDKAAGELDDAKVVAMYQEGQKYLYDNSVILPLYWEPQLIGVNKKLKGLQTRVDEYVICNYCELTK